MKKFKLHGLCIVMLLLLVLGFKIFKFFEIDSYLDRGGKWDYENNNCITN